MARKRTTEPSAVRVLSNMTRIKFQDVNPALVADTLDVVTGIIDDFHHDCMTNEAMPVEEKGRIGMTIAGIRAGILSAKTTLVKKAMPQRPERQPLHNDRFG